MSIEDQNKEIMPNDEHNKNLHPNSVTNSNAENNTASTQAQNTSGMGKDYPVPEEVAKGFNWGACLLGWIWGIGNKTYITFLSLVFSLIPLIGGFIILGLIIWFGIKGNTWAWQNKHFDSVEAFHSYQSKWATASFIIFVLSLVYFIAKITLHH